LLPLGKLSAIGLLDSDLLVQAKESAEVQQYVPVLLSVQEIRFEQEESSVEVQSFVEEQQSVPELSFAEVLP
jgi:hypothetical protein